MSSGIKAYDMSAGRPISVKQARQGLCSNSARLTSGKTNTTPMRLQLIHHTLERLQNLRVSCSCLENRSVSFFLMLRKSIEVGGSMLSKRRTQQQVDHPATIYWTAQLLCMMYSYCTGFPLHNHLSSLSALEDFEASFC